MATIFHHKQKPKNPQLTPAKRGEIGTRKPPRLPQLRRAPIATLRSFRLTERDMAIVTTVYQYRALTREHIEQLFFSPTSRTRCWERLKLLYHAGYLLRTDQPHTLSEGRKPFVYWLDKKGAELIAINRGIEFADVQWNPKAHLIGSQFLYHMLDTNTIRIAILQAAAKQTFVLAQWKDEATLRKELAADVVMVKKPQGGSEKTFVVPDDYFELARLESRGRATDIWRLFVEIDRRTVTGQVSASTQSKHDWAHKVSAYLSWFHSPVYLRRYQSTGGRVLTVTTGERRAAHLKAITEQAGGRNRFWFTTFVKATPDAVLSKPIWSVASRDGLYALTAE